MTTTFSATQVAAAYDLNGRSFRRYLRSTDRTAGKGHTHSFNGLRSPQTIATVRAYLNGQLGKEDTALTVKDVKGRIVADAVAAIDAANAEAKVKAAEKAKAEKAKAAKAKAPRKGKAADKVEADEDAAQAEADAELEIEAALNQG